MIEVIQIRLRDNGGNHFYNPRGLALTVDDVVILESERGIDFGVVRSNLQVRKEAEISMPLKAVIRRADAKDIEKIDVNKYRAKEALFVCGQKISQHHLEMKLIKSEYAFDLSKLIFYFTAEGRVDFRSLVKDLAAVFKTRIELRQIGARDEAKMFGGIGPCGRGLCCSTFLTKFQPVTIKMARDQNLSPNPSKISGVCGRLMCCLAYENETYQAYKKELPKVGEVLPLGEISAKVVDVNILRKKVLLAYKDEKAADGRRLEWVDFEKREIFLKESIPVER